MQKGVRIRQQQQHLRLRVSRRVVNSSGPETACGTAIRGWEGGYARLFKTLSITYFRLTMPPAKRQKPEKNPVVDSDDDEVVHRSSDTGEDSLEEEHPDGDQMSWEGDSPDTEDEIATAKAIKSKKTLKRKRRATDPSNFGATLNALLGTDAPSSLPLSLKPSATRKRNEEKRELKAKKAQRIEKKEKEDKGHISDVIGGWGGEGERALRKVAQRGGRSRNFVLLVSNSRLHSVVKLFNAIAESQSAIVTATEGSKKSRGTGKPSLPAPSFEKGGSRKKGKQKDNILGRGKEG